MAVSSYYTESCHEFNCDDGQFIADDDLEAETAYYLQSNVSRLRPSIVMGLAKCAADLPHMLAMLKLAEMAFHYPERAEAFAGDVVDSFHHTKTHEADLAYRLILIAAHGDRGWQSLAEVAARVARKVRGDE